MIGWEQDKQTERNTTHHTLIIARTHALTNALPPRLGQDYWFLQSSGLTLSPPLPAPRPPLPPRRLAGRASSLSYQEQTLAKGSRTLREPYIKVILVFIIAVLRRIGSLKEDYLILKVP